MKIKMCFIAIKNKLSIAFLKSPRNITRSAYIWNMLAGLTVSSSSVIMLMVMTRHLPVQTVGIYATSVAVSGITYVIASFNAISFQITDTERIFDFSHYFSQRLLSCASMLIFLPAYIWIFGYSGQIVIIIILQSCYRMIDALCDVFQGDYQVNKRLDIACKLLVVRQIIPDAIIVILVISRFTLATSIAVTTLIKILIVFLINYCVHPVFSKCSFIIDKKVSTLTLSCLPLFAGAFFIAYIQSAPKLFIERFHSAELQAYFTVIFMPAMIIHLFTGLIYRPLLTPLAEQWNSGQYDKIKKIVFKIYGASLIFTGICVSCTGLGITMLKLIFGLDVTPYHAAFAWIMLAGGFNAVSTFMSSIITMIRQQKILITVYFLTAVVCTATLPYFVKNHGIDGVAWGYLLTMAIQLLAVTGWIIYYMKGAIKAG